jgi:hypothetical protein
MFCSCIFQAWLPVAAGLPLCLWRTFDSTLGKCIVTRAWATGAIALRRDTGNQECQTHLQAEISHSEALT